MLRAPVDGEIAIWYFADQGADDQEIIFIIVNDQDPDKF
jgi:hypothetical protein